MVKAIGCSLLVGVYLLLGLLGLWLLCGCSRRLYSPTDAVVLHDTVMEERTERVVTRIDTVEVSVVVPRQSAEAWTVSDNSHLETDVAWSDAWLKADGTIGHRLENKDVELSTIAYIPATETERIHNEVAVREIPVPYPVEVERELTWWQRTRLNTWGWLVTALALCIGWLSRKPLLTLARRLLTKTT